MSDNSVIDPNIFRSYDIRGIFDENLNTQVIKSLPAAFLNLIPTNKIILGYDARFSSPEIFSLLAKKFLKLGVDVVNIGLVGTDVFYHACSSLRLPGIMITASHNPSEYNGFKIIKEMPFALGAGRGMEELRDLMLGGFSLPAANFSGQLVDFDIWPSFVTKVLSLVDISRMKNLKVVIDAGNGVGGLIWKKLETFLPIKVIPLFFEVDGSFPNHGPDPLKLENTKDLAIKVLAEGADLGVALDADSDRCFIIDNEGERVPPDFLLALLARYLLKASPQAAVVYDVRCSWLVRDIVLAESGRPLMNKVGHTHLKSRMVEENAVLGGEVSGHYYFKDYYNADSGTVAALLTLMILSQAEKTMGELIAPWREQYFVSGEINFKVKNPEKIIEVLREKYQTGKIILLDGLNVDFSDWHFNIRISNTESLLRLNIGARRADLLKEKQDDIIKIIINYT